MRMTDGCAGALQGMGDMTPRSTTTSSRLAGASSEHMLRIAFGGRGKTERRRRGSGFDAFHRLKLRFLVSQRHFALRLANYALYRLERQRLSKVHYAPPVVGLESNGRCNLSCPSCITGLRLPAGSRLKRAALSQIRSIVDRFHRRSFQLALHRQGEALLNPDFYAGCAYAVDKGLWTVVHSNLSFGIPDLGDKLVDARLCNLVVSCDGSSQEIYSMYRRGGDVDQVFRNIEVVAARKAARRRQFPWITAKFIVFDHNWHEIESFRDRALGAGADDALFVSGFRNSIYATGRAATDEEFELRTLRWGPRELPEKCLEIWDLIQIDWDGGVLPCCYAFQDSHLFVSPEDAGRSSVLAQWNSPAYVAARRFFLGRRGAEVRHLPDICQTCVLATTHSSETAATGSGIETRHSA